MPRSTLTEVWLKARCHKIAVDTFALLISDTGVDRVLAAAASIGAANEFGRVLRMMLEEGGVEITADAAAPEQKTEAGK